MLRKAIVSLAVVSVCLAVLAGHAAAVTQVFIPAPADLWDLDHAKYYSWGIGWVVPEGFTIQGAVLAIDRIDNSEEPESNDHLYIHLLDDPAVGTRVWTDYQHGGDNWAGAGPLVANYQDPGRGTQNLSYDLAVLGLLDEFDAYVADGTVGFGFDPDCRYTNCGVSLTVVIGPTPVDQPVPEPLTLTALVPGLIGLGYYLRGRFAR